MIRQPNDEGSVALPNLSAPHLRVARFEDYDQISPLGSSVFDFHPRADWESLWVDNPLWQHIGKDWPIGWVLETSSGEIIGSLMNFPSLYKFGGENLIAANTRAWVVKPEYRGYGPWLLDEFYSQSRAQLFMSTTTGWMAAPIIQHMAHRIPLGDWQSTSYWITNHGQFVRHKLRTLRARVPRLLRYPAIGALWLNDFIRRKPLRQFHKAPDSMGTPLPGVLADPIGKIIGVRDALCAKPFPPVPKGVTVKHTNDFNITFDEFYRELVRHQTNKLLAERTSRVLTWHFGMPMRRNRLWIFMATQKSRMLAYCVLIRSEDGREVQLADYQTIDEGLELLPSLLQAALKRCAAEGVHMLENYGTAVPKLRALDELAPHRRKLQSWRFYYRASDPILDAQLRDGNRWDPSVYDGDASLE